MQDAGCSIVHMVKDIHYTHYTLHYTIQTRYTLLHYKTTHYTPHTTKPHNTLDTLVVLISQDRMEAGPTSWLSSQSVPSAPSAPQESIASSGELARTVRIVGCRRSDMDTHVEERSGSQHLAA